MQFVPFNVGSGHRGDSIVPARVLGGSEVCCRVSERELARFPECLGGGGPF